MRLKDLYIDGFGHFNGQTIGPLNPSITVLYGPNEAGKSTLLAFIRTILFGFKRKDRSQFYPPLVGGKHGGRITLSDDEGSIYTLERSEGPNGGPYILHTDSGELQTEPAILQRLTGYATLDLFSNIFAFSLDEIQSEGLMNNAEVSSRLYSTGIGASALPEFMRKLDKRREDLFRPRGSTQKIAVLIQELNEVDRKLQNIRENAEQYRQLTNRQAEISSELAEIVSHISHLNTKRTETQSLLKGWDSWVVLEDCEKQLQDIPKFERFPERPIERLEDLQSRIRIAREERNEAADELLQIEKAIEVPIPSEALLNDVENIETIRRERTRFDDSVDNLPKLRDELRELEHTLHQHLLTLGPQWDEESLDACDTSLAIQQESENWRQVLSQSEGEVERARILLEESRRNLKELQNEEQEASSKLQVNTIGLNPPSGNLGELLYDQKQIEQIRRSRGSFNDSVRDLPKRLAELSIQKEDIVERLRELGPNWDEVRLENFDISIAFRQETERWQDTLTKHREQAHQAKYKLDREKLELAARQTDFNRAQSQMPTKPSINTLEIEIQRSALRTTRSRLNEHIAAKNNLENLQRQLESLAGNQPSEKTPSEKPSLLPTLIFGLMGLVLIFLGAYLGQEALILGSLGGAVMLAVATYFLFRRQKPPETAKNLLIDTIAQKIRDAKLATEETRRLLVETSKPLDLDGELSAEAMDNAEEKLDLASRSLSTLEQADLRVKEAASILEEQQKRFEETSNQETSAVKAENETQQEWRQWLKHRGMPENFKPETVFDFIGRIEVIREKKGEMDRLRQRISAIEKDIEEYMNMLQPLATKYRIQFEDANHQQAMSVADTLIENFDSVHRLVEKHEDVKERLSRQEQTETAALNEYNDKMYALQEKQSEWHNWLRTHELDDTLMPEALLDFLRQIEAAKKSRAETQKMRSQVDATEENIDKFRNWVKPLCEAHGISLDLADGVQLAEAADTLTEGLEETQKLYLKRQGDQQLKEQKKDSMKRLEDRLLSVEDELSRFLESAGAADEEDLRYRAEQNRKRLELESQRKEHLLKLSSLSGPDERLTAFRESLTYSKLNQLEEDLRDLPNQIDEANKLHDRLRDESVENNLKLKELSSEEESSDLRVKSNILMEQLREKAREWSRLTIAGEILRQTQQKFEKERQPSVIQHSEYFFRNITGQQYQYLYAPIGQQTIKVRDSIGRDKEPSQLSRGTREQLYLALRFGLIQEFGKHAEHLPVIVDEALVNFDSERASLAAGAFAELSKTNQVLVFTCHRNIADIFANVGATVIDIGR